MAFNGKTRPGINGHEADEVVMHSNGSASATSQFTGTALETLLADPSIASQPPYQVMQSRLPFERTSKFWWDVSASALSKLMTKTVYPLPLHYANLAFYYDVILSGYGPIPSKSDTRGWKASVAPDGSAFEPSWNLRTNGTPEESAIRFTIEPNNAESASKTDPLNQKPTENLMSRITAASTSFDLTIYDYLKKELFFDNDEAARLRREFPEHLAPQSYFAFDFEKHGQILGKGCLFLFWKSKATGQPQRELAANLITNTPIIGSSLQESVSAWKHCLATFPEELGGEPTSECIGFDLLRPSEKSRLKVYSRLPNSSFRAVSHFYTLGGLLNDATTLKGLGLLKLFWHVVCGIEEGADFDGKQVPIKHEGWADIIVNWEFKPGEVLPKPKFYMPLWKWLSTDLEVCERLSEYWRRIGWNQQAENYTKDWQETFPWLDSSGHGGMNYVSFAYKDDGTGVYMSLYFSPQVPTAAEKLDIVR